MDVDKKEKLATGRWKRESVLNGKKGVDSILNEIFLAVYRLWVALHRQINRQASISIQSKRIIFFSETTVNITMSCTF